MACIVCKLVDYLVDVQVKVLQHLYNLLGAIEFEFQFKSRALSLLRSFKASKENLVFPLLYGIVYILVLVVTSAEAEYGDLSERIDLLFIINCLALAVHETREESAEMTDISEI
ncbi:hypothetical protein BDW71DRAFT_209169 [Aspergillus fruticulosus]